MKKKVLVLTVALLALVRLPARDEDLWASSLDKVRSITPSSRAAITRTWTPRSWPTPPIRGLLETLDPHSYFLEPENFSRMREDYVGKYYGLGIQIQKQEDRLVVIAPIEGTPAWRLGVQPGDVISEIDGESTKPISSFDAMQKLRGEKGTKVNDHHRPRGILDKPIELTIIREEIPLYSVPYAFMLDADMGYIFIRTFAETTDRGTRGEAREAHRPGDEEPHPRPPGQHGRPPRLVDRGLGRIPARRAPRSSPSAAGTAAYNKDFWALRDDQYEKLPLVVLIDQGTASASEIVSGAVMDNDRGLVVGHDSWGKGLVQTVFPLSTNMAVAITTAKYLTPSGRSIQRDYSHIEDYLMGKQAPTENREIKYTSRGARSSARAASRRTTRSRSRSSP